MIQDNPIRGRINAWFLSVMDGYMNRNYSATKLVLFENAPQTLVELGPGTGANLRYIPEGRDLIAIEPNVYMHSTLIEKAKNRKIKLDLRGLAGEKLDLETCSVDFVVCTLVLCTVENPAQVISEVRRVLKPGGKFVCIEHVVASHNSFLHRLQHAIRKPWQWLFEGCDLCRDTNYLLQKSGFKSVQVDKFFLSTVFFPIRPQIRAVCIN